MLLKKLIGFSPKPYYLKIGLYLKIRLLKMQLLKMWSYWNMKAKVEAIQQSQGMPKITTNLLGDKFSFTAVRRKQP
jgi:hypothetical protein